MIRETVEVEGIQIYLDALVFHALWLRHGVNRKTRFIIDEHFVAWDRSIVRPLLASGMTKEFSHERSV